MAHMPSGVNLDDASNASEGSTSPRANRNADKAHAIAPVPAQPALIAAWLRLLVEPGSVVEMRALDCAGFPPTISGYFDSDHIDAMATDAAKITPRAGGVYLTLNPANPDLLARSCNRTDKAKAGQSTKDEDILRRRWLFVDIDAKRPSGISASDAEKSKVKSTAKAVILHLEGRGWPAPIVADSGNGFALFYRIDLPADDGGLVHNVLRALAVTFTGEGVDIDLKVSSKSRLAKIPGTLARKGDFTPERPHRCSAVLEVPGCTDPRDLDQLAQARVEVVPFELLEALAAEVPDIAAKRKTTTGKPPHPANGERRLLVARWLADRGVAFREEDFSDGRKFVLDCCPFNPEHKTPDAAIFQFASGATEFKCFHNSCSGYRWTEAKDLIGPPDDDHFDPPRTARDRCPAPPPRVYVPPATEPPADRRPFVVMTTEEHEVTSLTVGALAADPDLYYRAGSLVRLQRVRADPPARQGATKRLRRPAGTPQIRSLPAPSLREKITRFCEIVEPKTSKKGTVLVPCHPPEWLVSQVHARGEWPSLRPLDGVIECPTLRSDGSVLDRPGYDEATGLLYEPNCDYPDMPHHPTRDDAVRATDHLLELVCDFPFAGLPHKAAWLAALLTMIGRTAIDGCCPLMLFDASAAGTGKTKLADLISTISTGRKAAVTPCPQEDDEMRKLITSVVLAGDRMFLLDNLDQNRRLGGPALDAALTAAFWTERILSKSEKTPALPIDAVFMATGNNVGFRGDTHRRVLPCRIESDCENPEERDGWRFPDLMGHAMDHRGEYVRDAITILRAYFVGGKSAGSLPVWGSYEAWSDVVRQAVFWATTVDPCETRKSIRAEDANLEQLAAIVSAWALLPQPERPRTIAEILDMMVKDADACAALRNVFARWGKDGALPTSHTIANKLRRHKGRVSGGRRLFKEEQNNGRDPARWCIQTI